MKLQRYTVLVADLDHPEDPDHAAEHTVTILHGDQLRAELEGPRNGIPAMDQAAMHGITLWIWAALMRTHVIDQPFMEFLPRMLGFEDPDAETPADQKGLPDPTQQAAGTGSPSSSPTTTATSDAGSTPTPTTD
jgi:hypothetical protein